MHETERAKMISAVQEMIEEARKKGKVQTRSSERENQVDASCRSANLVQGRHSKEHDSGSDGEGTHSLEKTSPPEEIRGKTSAWLHVLRTAARQTRASEQEGVVGDSAPNKARQGYNQPRSRF